MKAETLFYWVSIFAVLAGGMIWLTTIDNKASAAFSSVDQNQKQFEEIRTRLTHIEDILSK